MNVYTIDKEFDYAGLSLANPGRLQGGAYYSKIKHNDMPIYIQSPKCSTKNGIVVTGKKTYCDIMFSTNEQSIIDWIIDFEKKIKEILFTKSSLWFHNAMEMDDIEYFFNSSLRTYKGNKQLMRTYVHTTKNNPLSSALQVYDENETIRQINDIIDSKVIAILYLKGIKFTQNSFQVDIELKQVMLLDDIPEFSTCMIKHNISSSAFEEPRPISPIHMTQHLDTLDNSTSLTDASTNIVDSSSATEDDDVTSTQDIVCDSSNTILSEDVLISKSPLSQDLEKTECDSTNLDSSLNSTVITPTTTTNSNDSWVRLVRGLLSRSKDQPSDIQESLDISQVSPQTSPQTSPQNSFQHSNHLEEVELFVDNSEPITLKKPNEVFYEIYKEARKKAKLARKVAIIAYLEAKNIKKTYMLDELDSGSDDDLDNLSTMSDEKLQEKL